MRPSNARVARRTLVVGLALTLSLLSSMLLLACSDGPAGPTSSGGPPPPPPPPSAADVAFCPGLEPVWLAFQDGDGAWTQALPIATRPFVTFHHTFTADRGAVATARRFRNGLTSLAIQYGTPSELAIVGDTNPQDCNSAASATTRTLLGSVAGLDTNEIAVVSAGRSSRDFAFLPARSTFTLRDLAAGPQNLLATRTTRVGDDLAVTGMILRRGVELADGATIPVFDFGSPEAFRPAVRSVTFAGLGAEGVVSSSRFRTAISDHELTAVTSAVTATTRPYYAVPEARLEPGDLQFLTATTAPSGGTVRRATAVYFRSPLDRTLTFGGLPSPPQLSVASSAPTLRLRARLAPDADYDRFAVVGFQQGQNTTVSVGMTSAYARLIGGVYDLVVPELTGVQGFDPRWALAPGVPVLWTTGRIGGTVGLGPNAVPADGDTQRDATDVGDFTP